ncbi:MAG: hypothetical protein OXE95_09690 [Chloroflexi bacterium]|nr:hypothetical protein [Chloroflexota bacterium]MCY4247830.1 hypothetical protein [Chloroflexota bacterium]
MTSIDLLRGRMRARGTDRPAAIPADSIQLDRLMALAACLITFGLFIDGWAHNHGRVDDSFFTPWHALLYGAVGLSGLILIVTHMRNVSKGFRFSGALPAGYTASLVGFFMFAAGGVADMVWHEVFGFEENIEALISPSHLFLAVAGLMIVTGPIRAAWQRRGGETWSDLLPAVLSLTCITSIFLFFVAFAAITSSTAMLTGSRPASTRLIDGLGVVGFLLHSNILLGVLLLATRRWRLPVGTATLIFVGSAALMTWLRVQHNKEFLFVLSALAVGLLADWLLQRGALETVAGTRLFSIVIPFAYSLGALIVVEILGASVWGAEGLWWLIHMWLGVPVMAGAFGYGLSLLMRPPAAPA